MADLLRNPTTKKAIAAYEELRAALRLSYPVDATLEVVAMACVHKARLVWPQSTKRMVQESKAWLVDHGMRPSVDHRHHGTVQ